MTKAEAIAEMEAGGFGGAQRVTKQKQWVVWREGDTVMSEDLPE